MTAILYVSQLPSAGSAAATDLVPLTQGSSGPGTGTTRTVTVAQLTQAAAAAGSITALVLSPVAAPATPTAKFVIYMDTADNKLKAKGPSGTVTVLALP